jgi:hypothetical protein
METTHNTLGAGLTSKAVAFAAALFTTLFILASTALIFTSGASLGA